MYTTLYRTGEMLLIFGVGGVLIGYALFHLIVSITKKVFIFNKIFSGIEDKDISVKYNSKDESDPDELNVLGLHFNSMLASLKDLLINLRQSSKLLFSNAESLATSGNQINQSVQSQNASTQNISATIEELSVSISSINDNCGNIQQQIQENDQHINDTFVNSEKSMNEMSNIENSVKDTYRTVESLNTSIQSISKITNVINDISNQTNLLALNAAIEAARAGEAGRGFAVVADEVRKLAENTLNQTKSIEGSLHQITNEMNNLIMVVREDVNAIARAKSLTEDNFNYMQQVVSKSKDIVMQIGEITVSLSEQKQASELIAKETESIAVSSEENSSAIQHMNDLVYEIESHATELDQLLNQYKM